jgi:hypothetical protein
MKKTGFEFWRHLWDDKRTDIAVIFAGGDGCLQGPAPRAHAGLQDLHLAGIHPHVQRRGTRHDPRFHPVWADVDIAPIDAIDKHAAHGSFRNWANITTHILGASDYREGEAQ